MFSFKKYISIGIVSLFFASNSFAVTPVLVGGSNHAFYKVDLTLGPTNCREPFGIIANYHEFDGGVLVRDIVKGQLATMFANGQRRLRVPIIHSRGAFPSYTQLDSTGGNLNAQQKTNLLDFIADIGDAGFWNIIVGYFPQALNNPEVWGTTWQESYFQENWNLIYNLQADIESEAASHGISQVKYDLMNEGAPTNAQMGGVLDDYLWKLWGYYNHIFGKVNTVGFSMIGWQLDRYTNMRNIYLSTGYGLPYVYDVHFYDNFATNFVNLDNHMNSFGDTTSWLIGETYYDDAQVDADLASISTSRTIWQIYQWPLSSSVICAGVDVSAPLNYRY